MNLSDYEQGLTVGGAAMDTALLSTVAAKSGSVSAYQKGASVGLKGERFGVSVDYMSGAKGVGVSIRDFSKSAKYRDTRLIASDFHDIRVLGENIKLPHIDITIGNIQIKHFPWNLIDKIKK